jgi:cell division septal protein FtsQ
METRSRPRPAAVRVRSTTRPRGRVAAERGPGLPERVLDGLRAPGLWWWCLAKLAALTVLLAGGTLLYHLVTSPSYYVSEVTVEGNRLLATQQVGDAAAVSGVHILWVNGRQVAQRLQGLPAVASAEVRPIFPRRVAIRITERVPYAQWQLGAVTFLVDREGRVIGPAARGDSLVLVRETRAGAPPEPFDVVPSEAVRAAVQLSALLPPAWQPSTGVFEYAADMGIAITTRGGWQVRFGDDADLAWKVTTFEALAAEIERQRAPVQVVDVRFPGRPYYR